MFYGGDLYECFVWKIFSATGRLLAVKPNINNILWLQLATKPIKKVIVKLTTPWFVKGSIDRREDQGTDLN